MKVYEGKSFKQKWRCLDENDSVWSYMKICEGPR